MKVDAGNAKSIDVLNIGLICLSLVIAFKIPFQLFLFSYAVLGPLHYVTEINWLEGKSYFIKERKWIWVFVLLALFMTIPIVLRLPQLKFLDGERVVAKLMSLNREIFFSVLFISFIFSFTLVYLKKWQHILGALLATLVFTVVVLKYKLFSLAFLGMFLPTIVHVYLFTWLFMIYGTFKTKNRAGIIACVLLLICPFIIFGSTIASEQYQISDTVRNTFLKSDFQHVSSYMAKTFGGLSPDGKFYLGSDAGIKIQIFIAFCYTYHYLNWFSKTSVIGWNKNISRPKLIALAAFWLTSLALYWYDYKVGFALLYTISLAHVFFEFPLNIHSVRGIFHELFGVKKEVL